MSFESSGLGFVHLPSASLSIEATPFPSSKASQGDKKTANTLKPNSKMQSTIQSRSSFGRSWIGRAYSKVYKQRFTTFSAH